MRIADGLGQHQAAGGERQAAMLFLAKTFLAKMVIADLAFAARLIREARDCEMRRDAFGGDAAGRNEAAEDIGAVPHLREVAARLPIKLPGTEPSAAARRELPSDPWRAQRTSWSARSRCRKVR